jgi:phosphomannomutase
LTRIGIDKAYGVNKLIKMLGITKKGVLFVGDQLSQGGNDHPVKAMGVDCLEVAGWQQTALVVRTILVGT